MIAKKIMEGVNITDFENRYCRKDSSCTPVIWMATWSPDDKLMYCIARNGTEKKQTLEQLKKYADELKSSNIELQQFAYVASHDLQEPLRMVSSFLQLLEKKYKNSLDAAAQQYIHFAVDGAERMKKLILDLLAYSRVGSSKEEFCKTNMNQIACEVIDTFRLALQETKGEISVKNLPVINAVKTQMLQLLQNLVGNAIKYRDNRPPRIEISCDDQKEYWQFRVKDNGIGIEPQYYDKVFEIFQRLHTKGNYSGTGIGLAVCKKIVERHGGKIHVESNSDEGSVFTFTIKK